MNYKLTLALVLLTVLFLAGQFGEASAWQAVFFMKNTTAPVTINSTSSPYIINLTADAAILLKGVSTSVAAGENYTFFENPYNGTMRNISQNISASFCLNATAATGASAQVWLYNYSTIYNTVSLINQSSSQAITVTAACTDLNFSLGGSLVYMVPSVNRLEMIVQLIPPAGGSAKMFYGSTSVATYKGNLTFANITSLTETVEPQYFNNNTNTTASGQIALLNVNWTDENQLANYTFTLDNGNGTLNNFTTTAMQNTGNWSQMIWTLNSTIGSHIRWGVYTYNVQGLMNFTGLQTFTTVDFQAITSCQPLTYTGAEEGFVSVYDMNTSLAAANTCFTFAAANVTLNCTGFPVYYAQTGPGSAVNDSVAGFDNDTIENCTFIQNSTFANSEAIYLNGTAGNFENNLTIYNTTILTNSTNSTGINLQFAYNDTISLANVTTNGTYAYGAQVYFSALNNFSNDYLLANNYSTVGLYLWGANATNVAYSNLSGKLNGYTAFDSINNTLTSGWINPCQVVCNATYEDLNLSGSSNLTTDNESFNFGSINWGFGLNNNITVNWLVDANVSWYNGTQAGAAATATFTSWNLTLTSNYNNLADTATGVTPYVEVTQFIGNNTRNNTLSPYNVTGAVGIYNTTLNATINYSQTVDITVHNITWGPDWFFNWTNSTRAAQFINFTLNWTDNLSDASYIFSFDNGSGTFVNYSSVNFNGMSNWSNTTEYVNQTGGSLIRWQYYANDTNGFENSSPIFYINRTENPVGGGDNYLSFTGVVQSLINNTAQSGSLFKVITGNTSAIYFMPHGANPNWLGIYPATLAGDMPNMDAALGISDSENLLEANYNSSKTTDCGVPGTEVMNTTDHGFQVGVFYTGNTSPGYSAGDTIIFCSQVNSTLPNYLGLQTNYESVIPAALGTSFDIYVEGGK